MNQYVLMFTDCLCMNFQCMQMILILFYIKYKQVALCILVFMYMMFCFGLLIIKTPVAYDIDSRVMFHLPTSGEKHLTVVPV